MMKRQSLLHYSELMILLASQIPDDNEKVDGSLDMDESTEIENDGDNTPNVSDQLTGIIVHQQVQIHSLVLCAVQTVAKSILIVFESSHPIPYHTFILTSQGWVLELLNRHPEWICTELGVHKHVFKQLVVELQAISYTHSKHVTLKE